MEFIYKNDDIKSVRVKKSLGKIDSSIMNNIKGNFLHNNYLEYLSFCYSSHDGIVIKPDYIWYTILCEITVIIKNKPESFRSVFTDSDKKKELLVFTDDPIKMPVDTLIDEVFKHIPSELKMKDVLLNFSTVTDSSKFGFSTAFLDAVSPYYNYSMYLCGYNKIKVLGTLDDYILIKSGLERLSDIFNGTTMISYIDRCVSVIDDVIKNFEDKNFWGEIFSIKNCGSGHQEEVVGWFSKLFDKKPRPGYVGNFNSHISTVEYENITTGRSFIMSSGILSSVIEDEYLVPDFNFYINEKGEKVVENEYVLIGRKGKSSDLPPGYVLMGKKNF